MQCYTPTILIINRTRVSYSETHGNDWEIIFLFQLITDNINLPHPI